MVAHYSSYLVALSIGIYTLPAIAAQSITLHSNESIHRLNIPASVLLSSAGGDQNLHIIDAHGTAVPMAWVQNNTSTPTPWQQTFDVYPIVAQQAIHTGKADLRIVESGAQRTVEWSSAPTSNQQRQIVGGLIDVRQLPAHFKPQTLQLDADLPIGQPITLSIASSDNLSDWQSITDQATIAQFKNTKGTLVQQQIPWPSSLEQSKSYIRFTWNPQYAVYLRSVQLSGILSTTAPQLDGVELKLPQDVSSTTQTLEWTLPQLTAIEGIHVQTEQQHLLPITLHYQTDINTRWLPLGSTTIFHLTNDGKTQSNAPFLLSQHIKALQIKKESNQPWPTDIRIKLLTYPQSIVFVSNGQPPYQLIATPNAHAQANTLALASLIPHYQTGDENNLPLASITTPTPTTLVSTPVSKHYGLWGMLITGVLLLSFMVWNIARQMSAKQK